MNRIPSHVGIIPDGNRRWALARGLRKEAGYEACLPPGLELLRLCSSVGVKELTSYGFTQDNTKRTQVQRKAFQKACIDGVEILRTVAGSGADAAGLKVGDVIIQIGQERVIDPEHLTAIVEEHAVGDKLAVRYRRDGKYQDATITLAAMPEEPVATKPAKNPASAPAPASKPATCPCL